MRLGLFGGTFDPIHLGHLILAESCREACALDRVWFVVAGCPAAQAGRSDRGGRPPGDGPDRRGGPPRLRGLGHRGPTAPGRTTASRRSRRSTRDRPEDELFFLIGADSLADLPLWRQSRADRARWRPSSWSTARGSTRTIPASGPTSGPTPGRSCSVAIPPIGIASHDLRRRRGRGPEHPLPGPPRRRGLHRRARAVPPGGGEQSPCG